MLDLKTLQSLIKEAKKYEKYARAEFKEHDNSDDMHAMEQWANVVTWLEAKLKG